MCGLVTVFQDHLASEQLALASSMALRVLGLCMSNDGLKILNIVMPLYRVSSFVWVAEWSPQYRPPMIIGICCLLVSIFLAFGKDGHLLSWQ